MAFWNRRKGRHKDGNGTADSPTIGQGIWYLYLIIIIQVAFVFGLMTVIITLGKVLATPLWVFIAAFAIPRDVRIVGQHRRQRMRLYLPQSQGAVSQI